MPAQKNPKIAFTTTILTQVGEGGIQRGLQPIKVELDDFTANTLGEGKDKDLLKAYAERVANDFIKLQQLLGLSLSGLKKITITRDKLPGAQTLITFNHELMEKLRPRSTEIKPLEAEPEIHGWLCQEDEKCLCSWCVQIF